MSKNEDQEIDLRTLAKTFPWIGGIAACVFGYVLYNAVMYQEIVFRNTRYTGSNVITLNERPTDYYMILALLIVLFLGRER